MLLLLITFGELVYLCYQFNIQKDGHKDISLTTAQMNMPTLVTSQSFTRNDQKIQIDESYLDDVTAYLLHQKDIKDGLISSSTLIEKYEGTIMEIENKK